MPGSLWGTRVFKEDRNEAFTQQCPWMCQEDGCLGNCTVMWIIGKGLSRGGRGQLDFRVLEKILQGRRHSDWVLKDE